MAPAIGTGTAILGAAGISGASSIAGGKKGSEAAKEASDQQVAADLRAQDIQVDEFGQAKTGLAPFQKFGVSSLDTLSSQMASLAKPFSMSEEDLQKTPGYKFTLDQGTMAIENEKSKMGLGRSGPTLKGVGKYAAGWADQTYLDQFNAYWTQNKNIYNMYAGNVDTGLKAAGALAGVSTTSASTLGGTAKDIGTAQASGTVGSANALTGTTSNLSNIASTASTNFLLSGLVDKANTTTVPDSVKSDATQPP